MRRVACLLAALVCVALFASCSDRGPASINGPFQNEPIFGDLRARHPKKVAPATAQGLVPLDGSVGVTQSYTETAGTDPSGGRTSGGRAAALDGSASYRLNFDDAELSQVVRAILADALQENYTTNLTLSGRVTISSERAVRRDELLAILENLLDGEGYALVETGSGYRIEQGGATPGRVDRGRGGPGWGISVVPLRYVSVDTISTILQGFVVPTDNLSLSVAENALVVRGPSGKRAEVVDAIVSFDADWMKNQSVSIFELRRAKPEDVVSELNTIFASQEENVAAGAIEFKALPRVKAVMALSKSRDLMRRASAWVRRLDIQNAKSAENVFVYRARYRNAAELANVVGELFNADTSTSRQPRRAAASNVESAFAAESTTLRDRFSEAASVLSGDPAGDIDLSSGNSESPIKVSADVANNAVVVFADGATYEKILATLKALDATPVQVAINVTIAEVRLTDQLEFGVQYFVKSKSVGLDRNVGSASLFTEVANTLQKQIPGFNFVVGSNSDPDVIISALDEITDVEILSSPSLVVVENETASLQVGDSVPVTVRQAQSVENVDAPIVNQVEFRDTGIILEVTPRIGENDAVTMKVSQEISAVASDADSLTPTFSRRRVNSAISVQSGQTVLLAGMISARRRDRDQGIPVLKDVPGVGKLFSETAKGQERTELVVLIRPVVIRDGVDAQSVAEELRMRMPILSGRDAPQGVTKR
ncbi:type II secretion system secretin GspD [Acuticoccus sp. I52.16.1]|uniref:type II secretion system secretin GspD n=1 Tax=Acuticoccus sp. I52.16.1 TaxID=2928472 RepID=UPI001FD0A4DE|nr:type II secretion system secretin GspD [Acuticoccus sp. I52.16.1]UOM34666.1 type II secretion system secretin GspD [Acuticoccus sp. I52.16.1]